MTYKIYNLTAVLSRRFYFFYMKKYINALDEKHPYKRLKRRAFAKCKLQNLVEGKQKKYKFYELLKKIYQ